MGDRSEALARSSFTLTFYQDDMHSVAQPFVSVIIPVLNDAQRLRLCLQALAQQTYPSACYEVIVVDNGSDAIDPIEAVVAQFDRTTLATEHTPGSYAARNRGIALAQGDVIAFTDADCIPAEDWLAQGVKHLLNHPHCGFIAGRVEIFFSNAQQVTPVELYEKITAFPQEHLLKRHHYAAAANIFTLRTVIEQVGVFDADLKSNGDVEWCQRVFAHGYQPAYAAEVCVYHPARSSIQQLYKRTIRLAGGAYDLQGKRNPGFVKRNLVFLKGLMLDLVPPLLFVYNAFLDARLEKFHHKLQVSLVMFFVRYISAWERIRLKLGVISARE